MGNNAKGPSEVFVVGILFFIVVGFFIIMGIWGPIEIRSLNKSPKEQILQRIESNQHQIILLLSREYPDYEKIHTVKKRKHKKEKNK